ncbi:MAG: hypothetical protein Q4F11_06080 [Eubacteriales bacterium]|nr:hypothetical protein [Eubacteriales bacterium]
MGVIIFIIIILAIRRNNNGKPVFKNNNIGTIIFMLIFLSVFASIIQGIFSGIFGIGRVFTFLLGPLIYVFVVAALFIYIIKGFITKNKKNRSDGGSYDGTYSEMNNRRHTYAGIFKLSRSSKKRLRIVRKFNDRYKLYLTDEQEQRIVDFSYVSSAWEHELASMKDGYESVYEWLTGGTPWLRTYLYVFKVQTIVPDLTQQESITLRAFCDVLQYAENSGCMSIESAIEAVNKAYFTTFDTITIMIARKFAESKGYKYKLPVDDDIVMDKTEELKKKYQI